MNYKIAKKLKKAGYKQTGLQIISEDENILISGKRWNKTVFNPGLTTLEESVCEHCILPTLDELIYECGEFFGELSRDISGDWHACSKNLKKDMCYCEETPEESVAELWLAINKIKK